jgi:predicted transcriptional regulator
MKRTTLLLTDELDRMLNEAARRSHRSRADIVREALRQFLRAQARPWPRSIGMENSADRSVTSEDVKDWIWEEWRGG